MTSTPRGPVSQLPSTPPRRTREGGLQQALATQDIAQIRVAMEEDPACVDTMAEEFPVDMIVDGASQAPSICLVDECLLLFIH